MVGMLPGAATSLIERAQLGTLDIHLEHRRLDATVNRLSYGVLIAALIVASGMLWSRDVAPHVAGASVPGIACAVLALILGVRLLRAIEKSGGLGRPNS